MGQGQPGQMINIYMNHAPGAGSIAPPVDLQSSALQLYYGCPQDTVGVDGGLDFNVYVVVEQWSDKSLLT